MGQKVTFRTRTEVAAFFDGLDIVDPGVVPVQDWRPDSDLIATASRRRCGAR
ncbi:MAG TPA: SAM-dependent methyltransferase [Trebonia sp.]